MKDPLAGALISHSDYLHGSHLWLGAGVVLPHSISSFGVERFARNHLSLYFFLFPFFVPHLNQFQTFNLVAAYFCSFHPILPHHLRFFGLFTPFCLTLTSPFTFTLFSLNDYLLKRPLSSNLSSLASYFYPISPHFTLTAFFLLFLPRSKLIRFSFYPLISLRALISRTHHLLIPNFVSYFHPFYPTLSYFGP